MYRYKKKLIIILFSLIIILSGISTAVAISIKKDNPYNKEDKISNSIEIVTLYRFGEDGSITPIKVEIEFEKGQDINKAIEEKSVELLENDIEFKGLLNKNISRNFTSIVRSRGKGFHLKFNIRIKWWKSFDFLPLLPSYFFRRVNIPVVFCRYKNDTQAKTTVIPIFDKVNITVVEGPHKVRCIGFVGFKWWFGHISWLGFRIRTGFVGLSIFTKTEKF